MTNEEAINTLNYLKDYYNDKNEDSYVGFHDDDNEAIDMAIKALKQQSCEDCVSREAVDKLSRDLVHVTRDKADFLCNFWEGLRKLPPVTPERPKGKWRRVVDKAGHWVWECDCKWQQRFATNFCPNCGAEMGGTDDGREQE